MAMVMILLSQMPPSVVLPAAESMVEENKLIIVSVRALFLGRQL